MKSYTSFKKQALKNTEVKKEYKALAPQFEIIQAIISKRLKEGLTQAELAKRLGTHQSAIARLESGKVSPTVSYLNQIALAIGGSLHISID